MPAVDAHCVSAVNGKTRHSVPSILLVGQPKSGTTTLFEEFKRRFPGFTTPEASRAVWRSPEYRAYADKELHYFPSYARAHPAFAEAFVEAFPRCDPASAAKRFTMDATPTLLYDISGSQDNVRDFYTRWVFPSVPLETLKIMVTFRDPVRRTRSCYHHGLREHNEGWLGKSTETNWSKWVASQLGPAEACWGRNQTARAVSGKCRSLSETCIGQSLHALFLRHWLDKFPDIPASNYFITDLETLADATDEFWKAVSRWSGQEMRLLGGPVDVANGGGGYSAAEGRVEAGLRQLFEPWERELGKELCDLRRRGATVRTRRFDLHECAPALV